MEDFANLLQRDYGLKPQGKMAPMSASKASSSSSSAPEPVSKPKSNRSARSSFDDHLFFNAPRNAPLNESPYNDVFGGPPKFTSSSSPVYDDIFRSKPVPAHSHTSRDDSLPVFDEDIFRGVPGTRSSASNVTYDNVFGTAASSSGSASDDLLGGYRSNHQKPPKAYESSSTYDDDLLGIGSDHQKQSKAYESTANYDDELLPDLGNSSRSAEPTPSFIPVDTSDAVEVDPFANIQPEFSSVPPSAADPLDPLGSFTNASTSNGVSDGLGDFDMFSNNTLKSSIRRQSSEPKSVRQNFKQVDPEPELDTPSPEKDHVDSVPSEGFEQFTEPAHQEVKETWIGVEDVRLVTEPTRTPPPSRPAPGFGYENSTRPPPAYENVTPPPAYENVRPPPPAYENVRPPPPAYENARTPPPASYENVNSYDEQEDYEAKAKMKKEREYRRMKEREEEERLQREKEEKERQRRAVEKITRETRERLAAQAREKAQKIAVEKASAEARERLAEEARRKAEEARLREEERQKDEVRQREQEAREARTAVDRVNQQVRQRAAQRAAEQQRQQQQQQQQERKETQHRANDDFDFFSRPSSAPRQRPPEPSKGSERAAPVKKVSSVSGIDQLSDVLGVSSGNTDNFKRNVARHERDMRTEERARRALEEKKKRDLDFQMEQAEKHRASEHLDVDIKRWAAGKEQNIRAMLSTLQYVLWPECGWQPVSLTDLIAGQSVKKVYRKATLMLHPDKVQQKGATVQQKYIAEKVFDLLKEAWNKFNSEELF